MLDPGRTAYEEMSSASSSTMVPMIRTILGGFLFSGDDISRRCGVLSGGERNRLALAKMLLHPEQPPRSSTSPRTISTWTPRKCCSRRSRDYGGTLIFVSHDRYFVDKLATRVVEVGGGQAPLYPGGYEDFLYWKKQREAGVDTPVPSAPRPAAAAPTEPARASKASRPAVTTTPPPKGKKASRPAPAPPRDPMAPRLRRPDAAPERHVQEREDRKRKARISELERRIAEKERAVKDLESRMAAPGFYDDRPAAEKAAAEHKTLMWEVGDLMSQWEMLQT